MCPIFYFLDFHYEQGADGDVGFALGEKTPEGVAQEVTATLRTLLHFLTIQENRQKYNKESYCAAVFDVLSRMGRLDNLSLEERRICEESKAMVLNRGAMPSPFDPQALFLNVISAPQAQQNEDE